MKLTLTVRFRPAALLLSLGLLGLGPLASATSATAQPRQAEPLSTDRPDFTEAASTVAKGRVQVEGGYTFAREGDVEAHALGEILVRIGVLSFAELRLGVPNYMFIQSQDGKDNGLDDSFLGVKLKLLDAASQFDVVRPSVALLLGTTLPTASQGFVEDEAQPEAKLALSWDVSEWLAVGSNLNFARPRDGGDGFNQLSGSLALGLGLGSRAGAYVEYFGFTATTPDGTDASFVNGGFTFLTSNDLQFDLRAGLGLNDPEPNYFAGVGFAWRR